MRSPPSASTPNRSWPSSDTRLTGSPPCGPTAPSDHPARGQCPRQALIEQMRELGIFGLAVPEEYGGTPVSTSCYVLVAEEPARGWMSVMAELRLCVTPLSIPAARRRWISQVS
ncbi:acyl-CoA dehydrogenase family protein [Streptomyces sp. NPDC005752]|uniref:acyl-CoA dehydrogenase family protein n=1 Tax=Streptomyces sp. NPDC005752 TaxID=3157065 RepID=UPI0033C0AE46